MPVYIDRKLNHPPTIIKEIPRAIAKRILDISSSEIVFNESIPITKKKMVSMTMLHLSQKPLTPGKTKKVT